MRIQFPISTDNKSRISKRSMVHEDQVYADSQCGNIKPPSLHLTHARTSSSLKSRLHGGTFVVWDSFLHVFTAHLRYILDIIQPCTTWIRQLNTLEKSFPENKSSCLLNCSSEVSTSLIPLPNPSRTDNPFSHCWNQTMPALCRKESCSWQVPDKPSVWCVFRCQGEIVSASKPVSRFQTGHFCIFLLLCFRKWHVSERLYCCSWARVLAPEIHGRLEERKLVKGQGGGPILARKELCPRFVSVWCEHGLAPGNLNGFVSRQEERNTGEKAFHLCMKDIQGKHFSGLLHGMRPVTEIGVKQYFAIPLTLPCFATKMTNSCRFVQEQPTFPISAERRLDGWNHISLCGPDKPLSVDKKQSK